MRARCTITVVHEYDVPSPDTYGVDGELTIGKVAEVDGASVRAELAMVGWPFDDDCEITINFEEIPAGVVDGIVPRYTYERRLGMRMTDEKEVRECQEQGIPPFEVDGMFFHTKDGRPSIVPDQWDDGSAPSGGVVLTPIPDSVDESLFVYQGASS